MILIVKTLATALLISTTLTSASTQDFQTFIPMITAHQEIINGDTGLEMEKEAERKRKEEAKKKKLEEKRKKEEFENNLYWLARVIHAENHDGCTTTKYYTGSVVLNRVKSKKYPNTIKGVIFQKGQYGCIGGHLWNQGACDGCKKIAKDLLENGSVLPSRVLYQAMFPQGKGTYAHIGTEYFCY